MFSSDLGTINVVRLLKYKRKKSCMIKYFGIRNACRSASKNINVHIHTIKHVSKCSKNILHQFLKQKLLQFKLNNCFYISFMWLCMQCSIYQIYLIQVLLHVYNKQVNMTYAVFLIFYIVQKQKLLMRTFSFICVVNLMVIVILQY